MNKKALSQGIALIELLIFMGLFSIVLAILTSLFSILIQENLTVKGVSAVESDSAYILARLQYDMDRASDILTPATNGESSDTLQLQIDDTDYSYSVSNDSLMFTSPLESVQLQSVRSRVTQALFERIGNVGGKPTIRISIILESVSQNASGPETSRISTVLGIK